LGANRTFLQYITTPWMFYVCTYIDSR
jgi:hypothetical protein